jgi:hypothetical protein
MRGLRARGTYLDDSPWFVVGEREGGPVLVDDESREGAEVFEAMGAGHGGSV